MACSLNSFSLSSKPLLILHFLIPEYKLQEGKNYGLQIFGRMEGKKEKREKKKEKGRSRRGRDEKGGKGKSEELERERKIKMI